MKLELFFIALALVFLAKIVSSMTLIHALTI